MLRVGLPKRSFLISIFPKEINNITQEKMKQDHSIPLQQFINNKIF